MHGPSRSAAWRRALCAVLLTATLLNYANRYTLTQNAVRMQQELGLSESRYGEVAGWFSFGFAWGGLAFGILADVISVRWLYPCVVLIWSLAGASTGMVHTVLGLALAQGLLGLFEAGHWPCSLRTTQRVFRPAERTLANSLLQSGASLGAVLTPLAILAINRWDPGHWRSVFFFVGGLGLPWIVAWLWLIRESDLEQPVLQTASWSSGISLRNGASVADEGEVSQVSPTPDQTGRPTPSSYVRADVPIDEQPLEEQPLWRLYLSRRWLLLLVTVLCINTVWHYIRVWLPPTLRKDHGYSDDFLQWFTIAYYFATFVGSLIAGAATTRLAKNGWNNHTARMTVFLICAAMTACSVPAAFLDGPLMLACFLIVAAGSLGLFPIFYSLTQELSARHQGKIGGTLGFTAWMTMAGIHPLVGQLVDSDPHWRPWLLAGVGLGPLLAWPLLAVGWNRRAGSSVYPR